jgi:hypothetical protein
MGVVGRCLVVSDGGLLKLHAIAVVTIFHIVLQEALVMVESGRSPISITRRTGNVNPAVWMPTANAILLMVLRN